MDNLIDLTLAASPAPAVNDDASPLRVFGGMLAPDLAYSRSANHARDAVLGNAPGFVDGVRAALDASEQGQRRDVDGIALNRCRVVTEGGVALLDTPKGAHPLRSFAFGQLARFAKAPGTYLAALPPSIALDAVNWGLKHHGGALTDRVLRLEGDEVRAIVSGRYTSLDDRSAYRLVYRALEEAGRLDEAQIESWSVGKASALHVSFGEVVTKSAAADRPGPARKGEGFGLRAGITVRNAELGNGSLKVSSGLWRHWCANGATIERVAGASWSRRHSGSWEQQAAELATVLAAIVETASEVFAVAVPGAAADVFDVDTLQARIRKLPKLTRAERALIARETLGEACGQYASAFEAGAVGDPSAAARTEADAVFAALQRRKLEDEAEDVIAVLRGAPEVTGWDLVNGVTAAARIAAEEERDDRAAELEALGGSILAGYLN